MKLIAIDLDGTLLDEDSKISQENVRVVNEVIKGGHLVTICTGRAAFDAQALLGERMTSVPIIATNGSVIMDQHGQLLTTTPMNQQEANAILQELQQKDFYFEITTDENIFIPANGKEKLYEEMLRMKHRFPDMDEASLWKKAEMQFTQSRLTSMKGINELDCPVYKILLFTFDLAQLKSIATSFANHPRIDVTSSSDFLIELIPRNANKGTGVQWLAQHYRIHKEDTIVIGDSHNDVAMFDVASVKIAMDNAVPAIKERSTLITKSHRDNGVAYALEHQLQLT
ncbi:HAD family phosphatase [Bacillaceae bacterium SIJ1]|uniref:Cof-type HAD-IIB family hydrolase n=1 Tax=Litoribacterium kuwaitense TaxID=1398745 RepID=UPI0013EA72DB|nr:Cof-type HAD-IIB family hydrolase [Litoribacterium kuwaitense]NGP46535.1 HAD family phosphatase [Litoribacterium kuwaitense]